MADNQNTQKYFLDLGGLTSLWNKIKTTFADKEQTQTAINDINISLGNLDNRITLVDNDVTEVENTLLFIAPRDVNFYSEAIEASKNLAPGTMINVRSAATSAEDETPSGYSTGIYVVAGPGVIQYLSTSDGDAGGSSITALGERVTSLEETVIKSAEIVDETGTQLGASFAVNNNVLLISHDDTFDINSESVKALTHRAVAAKFRNIENTLTKIPKFKVSVVDELPTDDISLSTIYLLRNAATYENNLFTEYIYVEQVVDGETIYVWEKLGEQTLVVDDIVTNDQLNKVLSITLADYAKKTDVQDLVNQANEDLKISILKDVEATYATKESVEEISKDIEAITGDLNNYLTKEDASTNYLTIANAAETYLTKNDADMKGWMTEDEIITSIQLGNIGNTIVITEDQIEEMIENNQ
jgi:hypothetical protein